MLPVPPSGQSPVIRRGMNGWPVFSLQKHLERLDSSVTADGIFGALTEAAVVSFQKHMDLTQDGVAGPTTQSTLVKSCLVGIESVVKTLPRGLLKGQLLSEGGLLVAPVNWAVVGGVDCGPAQYRVYGPPYGVDSATKGVPLKTAFSPRSILDAAQDFVERRSTFATGSWVQAGGDKAVERASRVAAFAHNWPTQGGADYYADHGHVFNPGGACSWLPRDSQGNLLCRFLDGSLVRTRQDWAEFYAMGGTHGEGMVTRFVESWT